MYVHTVYVIHMQLIYNILIPRLSKIEYINLRVLITSPNIVKINPNSTVRLLIFIHC